jgi:hypothetical protein
MIINLYVSSKVVRPATRHDGSAVLIYCKDASDRGVVIATEYLGSAVCELLEVGKVYAVQVSNEAVILDRLDMYRHPYRVIRAMDIEVAASYEISSSERYVTG